LFFGMIANFDAACEAGFFGLATLPTADLATPAAPDVALGLLTGRAARPPPLEPALRGGDFDVAGLVFRAISVL
jgi:hypothetical protein